MAGAIASFDLVLTLYLWNIGHPGLLEGRETWSLQFATGFSCGVVFCEYVFRLN